MTRKSDRAEKIRAMEKLHTDAEILRSLSALKPAAVVSLLQAAGWPDERIADAVVASTHFVYPWVFSAVRGWNPERKRRFWAAVDVVEAKRRSRG